MRGPDRPSDPRQCVSIRRPSRSQPTLPKAPCRNGVHSRRRTRKKGEGASGRHSPEALELPQHLHQRTPTWSETNPDGRWRPYAYDELVPRDKASLDIFWLRDESLADSANLPDPDVIAEEIVEDLRAALAQFEELWTGLGSRAGTEPEA